MSYKVGDLEVKINAISTDAISSLDTVIEKLSSLSSVLKTITVSDMKWISSFGTRMKTLSKRMSEIDWASIEGGFNRLTVAITPFLEKVTSAELSLRALNETLARVSSKKLSGLSDFGTVGNKKSSKLLSFGRLATTFYIERRLAGVMADIVQHGVDYTETLNLWQVAMRDNLSMATKFVDKMSKAYGISQKTLMQAQATFRNMIGSLGDLSDATSYALSEAITQMAIDYSSLYNAPISEAINKFQSALAGQVRPIRSISGYDITEKTIQALYEAIGGTKTQRQLSRTEKQLLAIYAIFNQMEKSGALGDMTKTLDNFANQSRMMVENWKEFATWLGTAATYLLQESNVMRNINAGLIFATDLAREFAFSLGYETPNFAAGWENNVENTIQAVDELKGKLLGFDKIRALQSEEEGISIDEKLLGAISGYSSLIDQANNKAKTLAETWKEMTFWQDGVFDEKKFNSFKTTISSLSSFLVGLALYSKLSAIEFGGLANTFKNLFSLKTLGLAAIIAGFVYLYQTSEDFRKSINRLLAASVKLVSGLLKPFEKLMPVLPPIANILGKILGYVINLVTNVIELTDKLHITEGIVWAIIGAFALFKIVGIGVRIQELINLIGHSGGLIAVLKKLFTTIKTGMNTTLGAMAGISILLVGIASLANAWGDMKGWQRAAVIIGAVTAALIGVVVAIKALSMDIAGAIAMGATLAGGVLIIGSSITQNAEKVKQYKYGGTPDRGTLFVAGEAGAEIVATSPNGQTGVSNVQQIEQAFFNALVRYANSYGGEGDVVVKVGEDVLFTATRKSANRRGLDFAKKS